MLETTSRHVHVFDLAVDATSEPVLRQIAAVRLDASRELHEVASFVRFVAPDPGGSEPGAVSLATALQAFGRFVGDEGALLSYGDEAPWLARSCARAGLPCPVDARRFGDAAPLLEKALAAATERALAPFSGVAGPAAPHDALHDARCVARMLRWLHARGGL
jgi:hypothetical protein